MLLRCIHGSNAPSYTDRNLNPSLSMDEGVQFMRTVKSTPEGKRKFGLTDQGLENAIKPTEKEENLTLAQTN